MAMKVEDLIVPTCQRCESHVMVHQFGWGDEGEFTALVQCKSCAHIDWFSLTASEVIQRIIQATGIALDATHPGQYL